MRRARFAGALTVAALTLSLGAVSPAFAADTTTAEHLFREGLDAMKREDFKSACEAFAGSNDVDPSPGTQINLALCNEKQGKLASAWGWFRTAAGLADQRGQKDRADGARAEAARLEPKLHKLVIQLRAPVEGATVVRDGAAVPNAVLGKEVPVDPGEHTVEVGAKGKKPYKTKVVSAIGPGVDRVDVPALEDAPEDKTQPGGALVGADYKPPVTMKDGSTQRNVGFIVGGAGIVAGVVAVGLELLALREDDKRKDRDAEIAKTNASDPSYQSLIDSRDSHKDAAKSNELGAIVAGATGVVLIGVGITLILTAPSGPKSAAAPKTLVVPLFGQGTTGLGLTTTF